MLACIGTRPIVNALHAVRPAVRRRMTGWLAAAEVALACSLSPAFHLQTMLRFSVDGVLLSVDPLKHCALPSEQ